MTYDAESDRLVREEGRRRADAARERDEWAEMLHIYERCVAIAEKVWQDKIGTASVQQQTLAEAMRNRLTARNGGLVSAEIPVPLFTPRDRVQFVKEVATTLFIEAGSRNRNLTAKYKDPNGETELAETKEAVAGEGPVEGASGTDETVPDGEGREADAPLADASQYGERVPQEAPPGL